MGGMGRRQYVLLGLLAVLVFVWFRFGGSSVAVTDETIGDLPPIDIAAVLKGLKDVATVDPKDIVPPRPDSIADRNLFQYGAKGPPPQPPMTEEQRRMEQVRLEQQEQAARQAAAVAAEEARKQHEAEMLAQIQPPQPDPAAVPPEVKPPQPQAPVKRTPPAIGFKFVGVMGSPKKKVGVFMNGEKMMLARKGEIIEGRFRVIDIGVEWADIGYTDPEFKDDRTRLNFGS